jgi:predicted  nucleic acid-binding Zn-ribbon protein
MEGTANLRQRAAELEAGLENEMANAQHREQELKDEIVALNQRLQMLEEFREQEHSIRRQLADTRQQLKLSEET